AFVDILPVSFLNHFPRANNPFAGHGGSQVVPERSALIVAIVLAASESTRTTRTPTWAPSTSRMAEVIASRNVGAARLNSREKKPLRWLNLMSPFVASYKASGRSGAKSPTPHNTQGNWEPLMCAA